MRSFRRGAGSDPEPSVEVGGGDVPVVSRTSDTIASKADTTLLTAGAG